MPQASIGIALYKSNESIEAAIKRADDALYRAKILEETERLLSLIL